MNPALPRPHGGLLQNWTKMKSILCTASMGLRRPVEGTVGRRRCGTFCFFRYSCFLVVLKRMCCSVLCYGLRCLIERFLCQQNSSRRINVWICAQGNIESWGIDGQTHRRRSHPGLRFQTVADLRPRLYQHRRGSIAALQSFSHSRRPVKKHYLCRHRDLATLSYQFLGTLGYARLVLGSSRAPQQPALSIFCVCPPQAAPKSTVGQPHGPEKWVRKARMTMSTFSSSQT